VTGRPSFPEPGVPILGLALSEASRDFWDNLDSRTTLRGVTASWPTAEGDMCLALLPGRSTCTRAEDHPGRHMATVVDGFIVSAWPGTHRPCVADLEDPE
jgi:hypothetical protein